MLDAARGAVFAHAYKLYAVAPNHYGPKVYNTISYKISGVTEYVQGEKRIVTSSGKLLFIPSGAVFSTKIIEPGEYIEIKFTAPVHPEPNIKIYSGFDAEKMAELMNGAVDCYAGKGQSAFFGCQVYLNAIFALVADISSSPAQKEDARDLLASAIDYLRENMFSTSFSVAKMQRKADLSDTHFRNLFKSRFKMTPQHYVVSERMRFAKHLLADHPSMPIHTVAESVGYTDPYYFSRLFKSETGITPSKFAETIRARIAFNSGNLPEM